MTITLDIDAIVEAADRIPGWMQLDELRWLAEQASTRQTILEIGAWQGRSSKALAMATPGVVYVSDDWRGEESTPVEPARLRTLFAQNLLAEIASGKVVQLHLSSEALHWMIDREWLNVPSWFDMIFIDGSHDESSVRQDIDHALRRLAPGGILCGHDHGLRGVQNALREMLPDARVVAYSIWAWEKPE